MTPKIVKILFKNSTVTWPLKLLKSDFEKSSAVATFTLAALCFSFSIQYRFFKSIRRFLVKHSTVAFLCQKGKLNRIPNRVLCLRELCQEILLFFFRNTQTLPHQNLFSSGALWEAEN